MPRGWIGAAMLAPAARVGQGFDDPDGSITGTPPIPQTPAPTGPLAQPGNAATWEGLTGLDRRVAGAAGRSGGVIADAIVPSATVAEAPRTAQAQASPGGAFDQAESIAAPAGGTAAQPQQTWSGWTEVPQPPGPYRVLEGPGGARRLIDEKGQVFDAPPVNEPGKSIWDIGPADAWRAIAGLACDSGEAIARDFHAGNALYQSGAADVSMGRAWPRFPSTDTKTWSAGGYAKGTAGFLGALFSPVTGTTDVLVSRPLASITGNPEFGERAGLVAGLVGPSAAASGARWATRVARSSKSLMEPTIESPPKAPAEREFIAQQLGRTPDDIHARAVALQDEIIDAGQEIAAETGAQFINNGAKDIAKVRDKIQRKGYSDAGEVTDTARAAFAVQSPGDAEAIVDALKRKFVTLDQNWQTNARGYADRKVR